MADLGFPERRRKWYRNSHEIENNLVSRGWDSSTSICCFMAFNAVGDPVFLVGKPITMKGRQLTILPKFLKMRKAVSARGLVRPTRSPMWSFLKRSRSRFEFSQTHKLGNNGIIDNFVSPYLQFPSLFANYSVSNYKISVAVIGLHFNFACFIGPVPFWYHS